MSTERSRQSGWVALLGKAAAGTAYTYDITSDPSRAGMPTPVRTAGAESGIFTIPPEWIGAALRFLVGNAAGKGYRARIWGADPNAGPVLISEVDVEGAANLNPSYHPAYEPLHASDTGANPTTLAVSNLYYCDNILNVTDNFGHDIRDTGGNDRIAELVIPYLRGLRELFADVDGDASSFTDADAAYIIAKGTS